MQQARMQAGSPRSIMVRQSPRLGADSNPAPPVMAHYPQPSAQPPMRARSVSPGGMAMQRPPPQQYQQQQQQYPREQQPHVRPAMPQRPVSAMSTPAVPRGRAASPRAEGYSHGAGPAAAAGAQRAPSPRFTEVGGARWHTSPSRAGDAQLDVDLDASMGMGMGMGMHADVGAPPRVEQRLPRGPVGQPLPRRLSDEPSPSARMSQAPLQRSAGPSTVSSPRLQPPQTQHQLSLVSGNSLRTRSRQSMAADVEAWEDVVPDRGVAAPHVHVRVGGSASGTSGSLRSVTPMSSVRQSGGAPSRAVSAAALYGPKYAEELELDQEWDTLTADGHSETPAFPRDRRTVTPMQQRRQQPRPYDV
jgi:hypothetical protein